MEIKELTEEEKALQVFEDLIKSVMALGGFKDFSSLDKCRDALKTLTEAVRKN